MNWFRPRVSRSVWATAIVVSCGALIAIGLQVQTPAPKPGEPPGARIQQSLSGMPVIDVTNPGFQARGNGRDDDTRAVNAAIQAAFTALGGTIYFPCGHTFVIGSQLVLPTSGGNSPAQPTIRFTGCGAGLDTGSILNLTFGGGPKIVTEGSGALEIDHLLIEDTAEGLHPLIYSPATKVSIHDNTFLGKRGMSPLQDAIVLGPPTMARGGFHGFGSIIRENTFSFIGVAVRLQAAANGAMITDNNIAGTCGGIAPIVSAGDPSSPNHGAWIAGNLIEVAKYKYAFQASNTNGGFTLVGNNIYDVDRTVTHAYYRFESSATGNLVIPGIQPVDGGEVSLSEGLPGSNTLIVPYRSKNEASQFLSGASLPSLSLAGSQFLYGVQGSGGTKIAAASGSFVAGDSVAINDKGDLVDSGTPATKTLRNCGVVQFHASASSPVLICSWVRPSSACSVVARDRAGLAQGSIAFTASTGSVSLASANPGSGSFSVACSSD